MVLTARMLSINQRREIRLRQLAGSLTGKRSTTQCQYVYIQTSGINTPTRYIGGIMKNATIGILDQLTPKTFQSLTSWLAASPASPSAWRVIVEGFWTPEVHSFLRSLGLLKKDAHAYYYLKTS